MKVGFISDTQLGAGAAFGTGDHGPGSRLADQETVLNRAAELFERERVQVVCHLGDVFERPAPTPAQLLVFQRWVRSLSADLLILRGNHDVKAITSPSVIQLFDSSGGIVEMPKVVAVGDVVFACLPWTSLAMLASTQDGAFHDDLQAAATEALVLTAQKLRQDCRDQYPNSIPVLLGHWSVSGSSLPNGIPVDQLNEPVIPWTDLDEMGWKLAAFGHIHKAQTIGVDAVTPMFYCGSACVGDWGEASTPHGVWIFDSEADRLDFHLIEDPLRFETITADFRDSDVGFSFDGQLDLSNAVARFTYLTTEDRPVDEALVRRQALEMGARKVFVKGTVERVSRARVDLPTDEDSIIPDDALDLWLGLNAGLNGKAPALRDLHRRYVEETR